MSPKLSPTIFLFTLIALLWLLPTQARSQAALLMEEPYGFFGSVNPTGHNAIYFSRICAETPVKLRRCQPDEPGVVLSRYQGIANYDWIAIPLIPYLYSVEETDQVPSSVTKAEVHKLRDRYHETHLLSLGEEIPSGGLTHGGWTELIGVTYERRIYALRFETTEAQDDALIAKMNADTNRSHFGLLYNNCSDFARATLNQYFPGVFHRSIFPDAGMTTPKQLAYRLEQYAGKHPELDLQVLIIPQIPGYRRPSRRNKSVAESLATTGYAIPIALINPYLVGGLAVDYLLRGHKHLIPKNPEQVEPHDLFALTNPGPETENPNHIGGRLGPRAVHHSSESNPNLAATPGFLESGATREFIQGTEPQ